MDLQDRRARLLLPTLASDGTVYVGCTDGFVYGVQSSGVIKWKYPAGGPVVSTAAIGNPIGSDTTLFMGGSDGTLHAVSANYGTSKWSYIRPQLHLNGKWQMRAKRPIVSSAALAPEGIVYIGADTALYALNAATGSGGFSGTVKWAYETRGLIMGSPALDRDGRIFVGSMDGSLSRPPTIRRRIHLAIRRRGRALLQPCARRRGRLYVGSVDSYLYALDSATGRLAWINRTAAASTGSSPARRRPGRTRGWRARLRRMHGLELYAVRQRTVCWRGIRRFVARDPEEAPPPPAPSTRVREAATVGRLRPPTDPRRRRRVMDRRRHPGRGANARYVLADERARREAETIRAPEGA